MRFFPLLPILLAWCASASEDRPFYSNNVTHATTWERPHGMPYFSDDGRPYWLVDGEASWMPESEDDAWTPRWTPNGGQYFESLVNSKTTWDRPASMGWSVRSYDKHFYHNSVTKETTRTKPKVLGHRDEERNATYFETADGETTWEAPVDAAWAESHSAEHDRVFFYNHKTKEALWEPPSHSNIAWHIYHDEISELL